MGLGPGLGLGLGGGLARHGSNSAPSLPPPPLPPLARYLRPASHVHAVYYPKIRRDGLGHVCFQAAERRHICQLAHGGSPVLKLRGGADLLLHVLWWRGWGGGRGGRWGAKLRSRPPPHHHTAQLHSPPPPPPPPPPTSGVRRPKLRSSSSASSHAETFATVVAAATAATPVAAVAASPSPKRLKCSAATPPVPPVPPLIPQSPFSPLPAGVDALPASALAPTMGADAAADGIFPNAARLPRQRKARWDAVQTTRGRR